MALTAKERAERLLELYEPDEELVWQTFSRKQIDGNFGVDLTDDQWNQFLEDYDNHEVTADDFGIGAYLPDDED